MFDVQERAILARMRALSPADLSMIKAVQASSDDSAMLITTPGTPNDVLWAEMATLGWLGVGEDFRAEGGVDLRRYARNEVGRGPIEAILNQLRKEQKISRIDQTLCTDFARQIIRDTREAGGNTRDLSILIAALIVKIFGSAVAPSDHKTLLDQVVAMAGNELGKQEQPTSKS